MLTTRIDIESRFGGRYATLTRKRGADTVEAVILTPGTPNGSKLEAKANDERDLWRMAEAIQTALDGHHGTHSMIHDYFRELQRLAD